MPICRQAEGEHAAGHEPGPGQPEDGERCLLRVRGEGQPRGTPPHLATQCESASI